MKNNREEFQKIFDKARDARNDLEDKIPDHLRIELMRVCELYFSAGQKNNF